MLDSKPPKKTIADFAYNETRFRLPLMTDPKRAEALMDKAQKHARARYALYAHLAQAEE